MDQAIIMTNLKVVGQYEYKNQFKILPTPEDAPMPDAVFGWPYPCIIQYENDGDFDDIERYGHKVPGTFVKGRHSEKILSEILSILSLFSIYRFFQYHSEKSWFVTINNIVEKPNIQLHCGFANFSYDLNNNSKVMSYPQIKMITPEEYYKYDCTYNFNEPYVSFPDILPLLLDKYFELDNDTKLAYLTSSTLFNQGKEMLIKGYGSIAFAILVSSIENLVSYIHKDEKPESCPTCGNINYSVTRKFKDFMNKFAGNTPEFKKYAEQIYKQRSKILHSGSLFLGEVEPISLDETEDLQLSYESDDRRILLKICRMCLINWLLSQGS